MTLHTVGPATMQEDEHKIGRAYQTWAILPLSVGPLVLAQYVETKWLIAGGLSVALCMLHEAGGRLHDLCIRLRRTNILLAEKNSN